MEFTKGKAIGWVIGPQVGNDGGQRNQIQPWKMKKKKKKDKKYINLDYN